MIKSRWWIPYQKYTFNELQNMLPTFTKDEVQIFYDYIHRNSNQDIEYIAYKNNVSIKTLYRKVNSIKMTLRDNKYKR